VGATACEEEEKEAGEQEVERILKPEQTEEPKKAEPSAPVGSGVVFLPSGTVQEASHARHCRRGSRLQQESKVHGNPATIRVIVGPDKRHARLGRGLIDMCPSTRWLGF